MLNMNFWFFAVIILVWLAAFVLGAFAGRELQKEESEVNESEMIKFWKEAADEWEELYRKENEEKAKWHKKYFDLKCKNEE